VQNLFVATVADRRGSKVVLALCRQRSEEAVEGPLGAHIMRSRNLFAGAFATAYIIFSLLNAPQAGAVTIYSYTGPNFTNIIDDITRVPGTYTTNMNVSGSFTVQDPLPALMPLTLINASVVSFSFFDGRNTITEALSSLFTFRVETDQNGQFSHWIITIFQNPFYGLGEQRFTIGTSNNGGFGSGVDQASIELCEQPATPSCLSLGSTDAASVGFAHGTWSSATTPVPAALPLFATGLGALGLLGWRRKRRTPQRK